MQNARTIVKDYIFITLGAFILAVAVNVFLIPMKVSTGGISGIGTVLYYSLSVPLSVTTLVLNAILFIFGVGTLGKTSVIKTASGIILLAVFLEVTENFGSYNGDIFIASIFGGILAGLGVGLTVLKGASTGGSDFAGIMLHRLFPHISVPNFIFIIDVIIISFSGFVFRDFTLTLYSALSLYVASKITDTVLIHGDRAKSVLVISKKSEDISERIMTEMKRGVTGIYCRGMYNCSDGMMLMCIVKSKEIPLLLSMINQADKYAFTVISDITEVRGEGFKVI